MTRTEAAAREIERLQSELLAERERNAWKPIETAPKDSTPVDLWLYGKRVTNMRRMALPNCTPFWVPVVSGPCAVREATHWRHIPAPPTAKEPT